MTVVNATSVAGIMGFAKNAGYSASKHAVVSGRPFPPFPRNLHVIVFRVNDAVGLISGMAIGWTD